MALDGGADGLDVARRVIAAAPLWLAPGGHLLVETSEREAPQAVETIARSGLIPRVVSFPRAGRHRHHWNQAHPPERTGRLAAASDTLHSDLVSQTIAH